MHTLEPSDLAAALVFFAGPWTVGVVLSGRMATAELAVARADQLEREREQESARAAAEERTRIARELHDIVSHSISVVTIQTQAVRRRLGPDHAAEAADLAAVEATAREAMAEMRRLFGMLRTEGERPGLALAPQPGLGELERLVRQVDSAEMAVRLSIEGDPVPLSPGVDLAAYRIAQEGLTNALRHAGATEARVLVRYSPQRLDVEVDGQRSGAARQRPTRQRAPRRWTRAPRHPRAGRPVRRDARPHARTVRGRPARREPAAPGGTVTTSIVIADDQGMVRAGFRSLLSGEPDLEVVGEAGERRGGPRGRRAAGVPTSP